MYLPRGPPPCQKRLRQVVKSHCLNCCLVLYRAQAGTIFLCSRGSISENNRIKGLPALDSIEARNSGLWCFWPPTGWPARSISLPCPLPLRFRPPPTGFSSLRWPQRGGDGGDEAWGSRASPSAQGLTQQPAYQEEGAAALHGGHSPHTPTPTACALKAPGAVSEAQTACV